MPPTSFLVVKESSLNFSCTFNIAKVVFFIERLVAELW